MQRPIPPDAETIHIPHVGEVRIFRDGAAWFALRAELEDRESAATGSGSSPLDAVADLLIND